MADDRCNFSLFAFQQFIDQPQGTFRLIDFIINRFVMIYLCLRNLFAKIASETHRQRI